MPQPGMNGMEPAFGEAYGGHRGLLSPYPLAMSPQGGRTEYDQSVLLMLGSPASPRKRPFELLSDLVDDGGLGEDLPPERWDVSALDEMARYTRLGLGVGGELLAGSEEAVLMGRWGRSREEQEEEEEGRRRGIRHAAAPAERAPGAAANRVGQEGGVARERTVEVYQVAQEEEEEEAAAAAGLALEHCSEEHNYSLSQGEEEAGPAHTSHTEEEEEAAPRREESQAKTELEEEEEEEGEEEEEEEYEEEEDDEAEEGAEETAAEAELSSSSESECGESRSGLTPRQETGRVAAC
ncbi:hypothetical protein EYF80_060714 [Liparis tanakae]|uniref:Uncharacterized protein n=1 Tax=Liparis tanakae TaxID=230148 RepID=A0A4Z2EK43_9TELE|nr:hypothetical protein EYF80_060714 [Liparis tanakae]